MLKITLENLNITERIGKIIAKISGKGTLLCMRGNLGAGKTTLTQFIANNLEVKDYVNSPSYSIMNCYEGKYKIFHYDLYKLEGLDEALDIAIEDYLYSQAIVIIEWADKIEEILPNDRIDLNIIFENNRRILEISGSGIYYNNLVKELNKDDSIRDRIRN